MSSLRDRIQAGKDGKYKGLDNGLGDINKYIYGIQRALYLLLGGQSGASKTFLADFILLNALKDAKKKGFRIDIFYYSFEINRDIKKLNWLSAHIYQKYNVLLSPQLIGGLTEEIMTSREQELVDAEIEYIETLFSEIHFRFESINPTGIWKELLHHANLHGKFATEDYEIIHEGKTEKKKRVIGYTHDDPNSYTLVCIDHIKLASLERGFTLKENIDKLSSYFIWMRNICKYSFIVVQQFNQNLSSIERAKFKGVDLSPQQSDFMDSSVTYSDSDVALGVMNPWKMDFKEYMGYDLREVKEKVRVVKVIKNRLGRDNVAFAYGFNANAGQFKCLPKAEDIELFGGYDKYLV